MKQRIVILGAGESGVGAALLAVRQGYDVFVSDLGTIKAEYRQQLDQVMVEWEDGQHSEERILDADIIVKSPGIPDHAPLVTKAMDQSIPVISEIEFAARHTQAQLIAITGSNGKTTTATWAHHMLSNAGIKAGLAGNIGNSFAAEVANIDHDHYVLELSSFQLDGLKEFKADLAVLLNITPDHLDRYDNNFEKYIASKFRIAMNQTEEDVFIYNYDDENIKKYLEKHPLRSRLIPFSIKTTLEEGAYLEEENLIVNINNNPFTMSIHELALQGKHNIYNSMAAGIAGRVLELRKDAIRESLSDFQNVEHRLEFVMNVHGIAFINDSKATNVNSTWYALESIPTKVVWIAGGVDKGNDYSELSPLVEAKVSAIVCLGKDNKKIIDAFKDTVETIVETQNTVDAVMQAYELGNKGETVLLSPACASFDLFENYEDRGHQFKRAVRAL